MIWRGCWLDAMVEAMRNLLRAPSPCPLPQGEGLIAAVSQVLLHSIRSVRVLFGQSQKSLAINTIFLITQPIASLLNIDKRFFPSPSGRGQGEGAPIC
jgi:hypothetical protein